MRGFGSKSPLPQFPTTWGFPRRSMRAVLRRLGRATEARQQAWRRLVKEGLDTAFVDALRVATNGGWALGSERFRKEIEEASQRRAAPLPRGPQPAAAKDARQLNLL